MKPGSKAAATKPALGPAEMPPLPITESAAPFPTEVLPHVLKAFVDDLAASLHIHPDLPGLLVLSAISSATAGRLRVQVRPGWSEPALIYAVGVAPPSSLKSPAFKAVMAPVFAFEQKKQQAEKGELAELREAAKLDAKALEVAEKKVIAGDPDGRKLVADLVRKAAANTVPLPFQLITGSPTPAALANLLAKQNGRIAVLSDEAHGLAKLLVGTKESGGVDLGPLLQGYEGGAYNADRKQAESSNIPAAFITLGLTAQPSVIETLAGARGVVDLGLTARICFAVPEALSGARPFDLPSVPDHLRARYEGLIASLLEWGHGKRGVGEEVLFLSADASAELARFHDLVEQARLPGGAFAGLPALNQWAGKHVGRVARIAGLLHSAEQIAASNYPGEGEISGATMRAAVRIGDYLIAHAFRAFDAMTVDRASSDARLLLEWVQANQITIFKRRDVQHAGPRACREARALDAALRRLCEDGVIKGTGRRGEYATCPSTAAATAENVATTEAPPSIDDDIGNGPVSPLSPLSPLIRRLYAGPRNGGAR